MSGWRKYLFGFPDGGALPAALPARHRFHGDYGLQLYSLRNQLPGHLDRVLAWVHRLGYREVEPLGYYGTTPAGLRRALDRAGLRCTSVHFDASLFERQFAGVVQTCHALGAGYAICSSFDWQRRYQLTPADMRLQAQRFNRWAARLRRKGLRFGYHNHDFDFRLAGGRPLYDRLLEHTRPELVDFEMDIFWVARGGQDPVQYLQRYPGRFRLMHLKDMRRGTPRGFATTQTAGDASVALGQGVLNLPAILRAAAAAGVERYYVEDESPAAPREIVTSIHYLKTVQF